MRLVTFMSVLDPADIQQRRIFSCSQTAATLSVASGKKVGFLTASAVHITFSSGETDASRLRYNILRRTSVRDWFEDLSACGLEKGLIVIHYLAIVEIEPEKAVGVWFPDVPGCFSGGDTLEEALANASEALQGHAEALIDEGMSMPLPRSPDALMQDDEVRAEMQRYLIALIPFEGVPSRRAAE